MKNMVEEEARSWVKTLYIHGTIKTKGDTLNFSSIEERRLIVSVLPFKSCENPMISKIKIVINILGTVV